MVKRKSGAHGPPFETHQDLLETPTYVRLKFFAEGTAPWVAPWWPWMPGMMQRSDPQLVAGTIYGIEFTGTYNRCY
jgi:hypothetical protein